jgi:CubicO group peptidase (beta-lactamase class C family)
VLAAITAANRVAVSDGSWAGLFVAGAFGAGTAAAVFLALHRSRVLAFIAAAVLVATASSLPVPPVQMTGTINRGIARGQARAIDRFVRDDMRAGHIPGLAVSIVHDGRIVLERGYGVAGKNRRPMTPATPQMVASLSKSFTAAAVAALVEDGKIDYDAPVSTYLPEFRTRDVRASATITIRQLLNQTSGIHGNTPWGALARVEGRDLDGEVRALRNLDLAFAPGTGYTYANRNYQVAGLVVQRVSGRPFADFVQRRILRPAGMTESFAGTSTPGNARVASGYRLWFGVPIAMAQPRSDVAAPSGNVYSSAHDLGRWMLGHLGTAGYTVLQPASYTTLHTPARGGYAMGWADSRSPKGEPVLFHEGHGPGATAYMTIRPQSGWGVAVIANQQELSRVTAAPVGWGIDAILDGHTPDVPSRTKDHVLVVGGLFAAVALTVRALTRLRPWRVRRSRPGTVVQVVWLLVTGVAFPLWFVQRASHVADGFTVALVYDPDASRLLLGAAVAAAAIALARLTSLLRAWS